MKTPAKTSTRQTGKTSTEGNKNPGRISRPGKPGNDPDMTPNREVTKRPVAKP